MLQIFVNDTTIPYTIRRSKKARRVSLSVSHRKVEVVAPIRVADKKLHKFINDNRQWVYKKHIENLERTKGLPKPLPEHFVSGHMVMYQGRHIPLRVEVADEIIPVITCGDELCVLIPRHNKQDMGPEDLEEMAGQMVTDWLKQRAEELVVGFADHNSKKFGLHPTKIRIRTQKHRWGSCSAKDVININWQLVFFPEEIMEYVVVHEICHIKHKNHSKSFWKLVEAHLPNYKEHYNWLKKNAAIVDL